MARSMILFSCLVASALFGCQLGELPGSDPLDGEEEAELPEVIPNDWIDGLTGEVHNLRQFTSGALEGTECTEVYAINGVNITDIVPTDCPTCDVVFNVFLTSEEPCPGRSDLGSEAQYGFELRQTDGVAVMWVYDEGWWESGWAEFVEGSLTRDDDLLTLDFETSFEDEDNGEGWGGNSTSDEPCSGWGNRCDYDGFYDIAMSIQFEWPEDEQVVD